VARFQINTDYMVKTLIDILNTPSPTGDSEWAMSFIEQELSSIGITAVRTQKGALVATVEGIREDKPRCISCHVDTLGAMVAQIKPNGRLKLTPLNGLMWPTVESEGVTIATRQGRQIRGSIVLANGAAHVNKDARTCERTAETLEVRIDERTNSAEETRVLGIDIGDFVYLDPRPEIGDAGFIRSRFLDDKACASAVLAALKTMRENGITPVQRTTFQFSNYEEVGHGGLDGVPTDLAEFVIMDMAAIGNGLQGDEYHCSICMKDSGGPYSRNLTAKLRSLAEAAGVDLKADIYPYYTSDGSAYWRGGGQAEVALFGPGVDTSHGYERTHTDAIRDAALLLAEYLVED
jgi:putative aminopeptidase FrvX